MKNKRNRIAGSWQSENLKTLENKFRVELSNQFSGDELEYRIAWEIMKDFMVQNFSEDIPLFMKGLSNDQLEMLPVICKSSTFVDSDRFIALINLESQRRSNTSMRRLTEQLNSYTILLIILTFVLIFIGLIQLSRMN
jgi:hypothetical protein